MWYELLYEPEWKKFIIWKIEGGKSEIVFQTLSEKTAVRAYELIEKFGHGAIRYPKK